MLTAVALDGDEHAFASGHEGLFERRGGEWRRSDLEIEGSISSVAARDGLVVAVGQVYGAGPTIFVRE